MPIQFKSKTTAASFGVSPTVSEPPTAAAGDVFIGLYKVYSSSATCSAPSGWTVLYSGISPTPNTGFRYVLCYITRTSSSPSMAFTHTGSIDYELNILCYSGVNPDNPIAAKAQVAASTSSAPAPDPPSITNSTLYSMCIAVGISNASASDGNGWVPPNGYTVWSDSGNAKTVALASRLLIATGTENPAAYSNLQVTTSDMWSATILLQPSNTISSTMSPLTATYRAAIWNSTPASQSLTVTAGAGDLFIIVIATMDYANTFTAPTGGTGVTWTSTGSAGTSGNPGVRTYLGASASAQTFTVTVSLSAGTGVWGFMIYQFMSPHGNSASLVVTGNSGQPQTTYSVDAPGLLTNGDFMIMAAATATPPSTTTYDTTVGSYLEVNNMSHSALYFIYIGYYPKLQVSTAGSTVGVGITSPTGILAGYVFLPVHWPSGTAQYINPSIGWF